MLLMLYVVCFPILVYFIQMNKGVPSYLGSLLAKIWKRF
jgi:hypothetical protein